MELYLEEVSWADSRRYLVEAGVVPVASPIMNAACTLVTFAEGLQVSQCTAACGCRCVWLRAAKARDAPRVWGATRGEHGGCVSLAARDASGACLHTPHPCAPTTASESPSITHTKAAMESTAAPRQAASCHVAGKHGILASPSHARRAPPAARGLLFASANVGPRTARVAGRQASGLGTRSAAPLGALCPDPLCIHIHTLAGEDIACCSHAGAAILAGCNRDCNVTSSPPTPPPHSIRTYRPP